MTNSRKESIMRLEDFGPFTLSTSAHSGPEDGMCVMEMVSFLAGEEWSDMPKCASPALSRFCQVINDRFGQEQRDQLQRFVPMLIGTKSPEHEQARVEILAWAADYAVRVDADLFPVVMDVLREAIEVGPHGTAYTDIHRERGLDLAKILEGAA